MWYPLLLCQVFFLSETSFVCATENWQVLQVSWVFVTSFNTFKMLQDGSSYSLRTISLSPRPSSGNSRPLGRSRNQKPHIVCQWKRHCTLRMRSVSLG